MTFDLREEPWIPCLLPNGALREVGIREALASAHEWTEIRCESPLATAAILRLLLAVLYRACGPETTEEWAALWNAERLPENRINAYLDGDRCRDRFDLFSEARPFLQVSGMEMDQATPLAALATEAATGNNPTLFDHTTDDDPPAFSPAEAARMLAASQAFALGFGKAAKAEVDGQAVPRPYLADAICLRGVTLFLSGETLRETLLLNLVMDKSAHDDEPVWERHDPLKDLDTVVAGKRQSVIARGVVDRYAWMSRMIRLLPEANGTVRYAYFTQGREADKTQGDPMKVYKADKKEGVFAVGLSAGKAAWRDLHSFIAWGKKTESTIINHAAVQVRARRLPRAARYRLNVIGLATDHGKAGKFLLWRHDRMSLPASLFDDTDRLEAVRMAIDDAEFVAWDLDRRVRDVARRYLPPEGNPDPKDVEKLSRALDTRATYWSRLESRFGEFLHSLAGGNIDAALEGWRADVEREAEDALREAVRQLGHSVRAMRAEAGVSYRFTANEAEVKQRRAEAGLKKRKGGAPT